MEFVEWPIDGQFVRAEKFGDAAGGFRGKTFFEIVDAVVFGIWIGEAVDAVEIVTFEVVLGGIFDHVPLDEVLGVVFFHIFFLAAGEQIDNFVAVEDEHGGRDWQLICCRCLGDKELYFPSVGE